MKFLLVAIVAGSLLASCSSSKNISDPNADDRAGPIQWVNYSPNKALDKNQKIVFISGDEEYRSEEALPQLAKILSTRHGFGSTVLFAQNPDVPGRIDPNYVHNIPGLETLKDADLMVIFTRFRELPDEQMEHIQNYLMAGKPVIAVRTSTHAFQIEEPDSKWKEWGNNFKDPESVWNGGFGRMVLGEKWHTHHGHHKQQSTRGIVINNAKDHPINRGLAKMDIWGPTDVYGVRLPMPDGVIPLVLGQTVDRAGEYNENDPYYGMKASDKTPSTVTGKGDKAYNPNEPMMPIAWTKPYTLPGGESGMAFTSTIGSSTDIANDGVRRLFVNATYHMLGRIVPMSVDVDLVGEYNPSPYAFHDDQHWVDLDLRVSDHWMANK